MKLLPVLFAMLTLSSCSTTSQLYTQAKALTPAQIQDKACALTKAAFLVYNSSTLRTALKAGVAVVQKYAVSTPPDPSYLFTELNSAVTKAVPNQSVLINAVVTPILYGLYQSEYTKLAGKNDLLLADLQALASGVECGM